MSGHSRRGLSMAALILSANAIFGLPFDIARIFRPTLLDVFGINNLELGTAFASYGVIAMVCYFPGGPLADRFSTRRLMVVALLTTAAGGAVMATIPPISVLRLLFAFWGVTTTLLFWAALIRATREWGGSNEQGRAYGILDGGRGLAAAAVATLTVAVFAALLPSDVGGATLEDRTLALQRVIWIITAMTAGAAVLVWFWIPERDASPEDRSGKVALDRIGKLLRMPTIWLHALIVVCAYAAFKGSDDFALFARDAFGFDDVQAARVGTISFWVRPVAAIGAGLLADRFDASRVTALCFALLIVGYSAIALGALQPTLPWMLFTAVVGTSLAMYGLRGVYFALFEEADVPRAFTGTAVGVVSVIGFTPDIFMGPIMGFLLDRSPGALGHQHVFGVLAAFSALGLVTVLGFRSMQRSTAPASGPELPST
jgi:MFS transporter, GlpU family, inner membrane protein